MKFGHHPKDGRWVLTNDHLSLGPMRREFKGDDHHILLFLTDFYLI